MANFLSKSNRLHTVSLKNCGVPDIACGLLFPFLSCKKKLKLVDLSQNEITNKGVFEICNIMDELCRPFLLKQLRLNGNNISDRGALRLLESIKNNQAEIEEIGLADNGLKEDFALHLSEFLKTLRNEDKIFCLKKFDLNGNGIALEGLAQVEKELHKNQLAQIEFELPIEQEKLRKFRMAAKQRGLIEKKRGRAQSQLQHANLDLAQDEEHKVLYIK
jgi:hypothetical protein